jgi:hypothetical protein
MRKSIYIFILLIAALLAWFFLRPKTATAPTDQVPASQPNRSGATGNDQGMPDTGTLEPGAPEFQL